jgi:hypothetical protein
MTDDSELRALVEKWRELAQDEEHTQPYREAHLKCALDLERELEK